MQTIDNDALPIETVRERFHLRHQLRMLFCSRLAVNQENKSPKIVLLETKSPAKDHQHLLDEIQSVTINSDERMKAIEVRTKDLRRHSHSKCAIFLESRKAA